MGWLVLRLACKKGGSMEPMELPLDPPLMVFFSAIRKSREAKVPPYRLGNYCTMPLHLRWVLFLLCRIVATRSWWVMTLSARRARVLFGL